MPEHLRPGLLLLLKAHDYAKETGREAADFAVEVAELRRSGMTNADCRWFACKSWVQLTREIKPRPGEARRFRCDGGLAIYRASCLVLTSEGERVARRLAASVVEEPCACTGGGIVPRWDRSRHELRLGSQLIKKFKLPSPNQEMILMAFEEESWPPRIDDPLPPSEKLGAKQRLHDTIKSLNRNQKNRLLRFMGDGTGQGILWELYIDKAAPKPRRKRAAGARPRTAKAAR